jgi:hypothetical protein
MAGRFRVRIPAKVRHFLFIKWSSPSVEPKWPYTRWVHGAYFPGLKRLESDVDHSPLSSAEAKNKGELHLYSPDISSGRGPRELYCFSLRVVY